MTRVDFYLIQNPASHGKHRLACRLADKAYRLGHHIYMLTGSAAESAALDELLWTQGQTTFVPHEVHTEGATSTADVPVVIGHGEPPTGLDNVLISLSAEIPAFFSRFERVAEVVGAEAADKEKARERFRFYRDRGYALNTHELTV